MRVFLDTNVLVSALVARGFCADLLRLVLGEHVFVTGDVVLVALRRILSEGLHVPSELVVQVERDLRAEVVVPKPSAPSKSATRDSADRLVLASAEAGEVDLLVAGDNDLLDVASRSSLPILSPRAAWERLREPR